MNRTLGVHSPDIEIMTMRPSSSPILSKKGPKPRGVRKVNTNFVPGACGTSIMSRVVQIRGSSTVHADHRLTGLRKLLINVSSNTTICTTARLTGHPRGRKGVVITLLPSANRHCLSAVLCTFRRCPL